MDALLDQVRQPWGLCCVTDCEPNPLQTLKRTRIDEDRDQKSPATKRICLSNVTSESQASDGSYIPRSTRKKLPSEAPPHRRRSILIVKPKQSKVPKIKVSPSTPGTSPVKSPRRGRDTKFLWPKWKPSIAKQKSKVQAILRQRLGDVKLNETLDMRTTIKETSQATSHNQTMKPRLEAPEAEWDLFGDDLVGDYLFGDMDLDYIPTNDICELKSVTESNTTTGISPFEKKIAGIRTEAVPRTVTDGTGKVSQSKRLRSSDEIDDGRYTKRSRSSQGSSNDLHSPVSISFPSNDVNFTAHLLMQISMICSDHRRPSEFILFELRELLKCLPVHLTTQGRRDNPKESAKFRSALNEHEASCNWDDLDSFEYLKNTVDSMIAFESQANQAPRMGADGCMEV